VAGFAEFFEKAGFVGDETGLDDLRGFAGSSQGLAR
jgi:hypothetical protein